ncbi:phosphoribomutase PRM15 [Sugiyamaella lignohabitans]|uniref:Phosphoribomutase PRM15 n=1 Tax=Sugiyamaella lignohabitans TaxID=796027 RepID=A0A167F3V9_9ASCO|nr:phosphoribomutase PRM15 [Sugiyamaella lignohabitans]ANB14795.1 phosphoribomutase PRM15 [Sugiyamaella lignohabitans]
MTVKNWRTGWAKVSGGGGMPPAAGALPQTPWLLSLRSSRASTVLATSCEAGATGSGAAPQPPEACPIDLWSNGLGIQFGTAGLRGRMEAGFDRMNDLTVLQASQGLVSYVRNTVPNAEAQGVVIGHDHRHNSSRFAELTALAFVTKGFKVYTLGQCHTPLVPFAIDEFRASCGVMVTASHNPAQDNGYKVYWQNGCQIIPPHDVGIAQSIEENAEPWTWDVSVLKDNQLVVDIGSQSSAVLVSKYFAKMNQVLGFTDGHTGGRRASAVGPGAARDSIQFVYTPMHGVGLPYLHEAASQLGLSANSVVTVNEQAQPDPDFPTVSFPNPEEKGALDLAMKLADSRGISIVLANDPDADRFAVAVKDTRSESGKWIQLTGNQVGAIFADHWRTRWKKNGDKKLAMLNSTVSSQLIASLAAKYGFHYEDTLTGFKWIGNRAITLEYQGYDIPFAFEEALGYMFAVVHDKDGISAAYVFIQILLELQEQSTTVLDKLESIYQDVGYFEEHNSYYIVNNPSTTDTVFEYIRTAGTSPSNPHYPRTIGRFDVSSWRDLTTGYDSSTPNNVPTLPVSNSSQMITVTLSSPANETVRFTARGSGTEPKLKVYIEAKGSTRSSAQQLADEVWDLLLNEWFRPPVTGLVPV